MSLRVHASCLWLAHFDVPARSSASYNKSVGYRTNWVQCSARQCGRARLLRYGLCLHSDRPPKTASPPAKAASVNSACCGSPSLCCGGETPDPG